MLRRIFTISDLHLGGRPDELHDGKVKPGFQICYSYRELRDFIDWISGAGKKEPSEELELIINGDIVDFLAEDDFDNPAIGAQIWTTDDYSLLVKLDRIIERTRMGGSRGVFDALRDFLTSGHRLTLLLGNHDVELSLPLARRHLTKLLGAENAKFQFIYDGEAYSVGKLLVEHGNRYDRWNIVDHSALRQERSHRSRGLTMDEGERNERYFVPPTGTSLVIHFINRIKKRYRFIDLLKPENEAVIPLLLALEPDLRAAMEDILNAGVPLKPWKHRLKKPALPRIPGDMGDWSNSDEELSAVAEFFIDVLGEDAGLFLEDESETVAGDLGSPTGIKSWYTTLKKLGGEEIRRANQWWGACAEQLAETSRSTSSYLRLLPARRSKQDKFYRRLHTSLRHLNKNDRTYDLAYESADYLDSATEIVRRGGFELVIFGHTHLPKKIPIETGSTITAWYFNTGTWSDVLRLPDAFMQKYETAPLEVERFVETMKSNVFDAYRRRYLTYAEALVDFNAHGAIKEADLYSYGGIGHERSAPFYDLFKMQQSLDETSHS